METGVFLKKRRGGKGSKAFEPVVEAPEPLRISRIRDVLSRKRIPKNIRLLPQKTLVSLYVLQFGFHLIFVGEGSATAKERNYLAAFRRAIRRTGVSAGFIRQVELQVMSQRNHRDKHPILNQAEIKALLSF